MITDVTVALGREYILQFGIQTYYSSYGTQKLKAAHPVNYYPSFFGKNIKSCPPSKCFLVYAWRAAHPEDQIKEENKE